MQMIDSTLFHKFIASATVEYERLHRLYTELQTQGSKNHVDSEWLENSLDVEILDVHQSAHTSFMRQTTPEMHPGQALTSTRPLEASTRPASETASTCPVSEHGSIDENIPVERPSSPSLSIFGAGSMEFKVAATSTMDRRVRHLDNVDDDSSVGDEIYSSKHGELVGEEGLIVPTSSKTRLSRSKNKALFRMRRIYEKNVHLISQSVSDADTLGNGARMTRSDISALEKGGVTEYFPTEYFFRRRPSQSFSSTQNFSFARLVIHPSSKTRVVWGLMSMVLLMFDLVFVPVDICFDVEETNFSNAVQLTSRIFWSFDIPLSFLTGVLHDGRLLMRPVEIARIYCRTWFPFDCTLVVVEWLTFLFLEDAPSHISMLRAFRWSRMARLLRLLRFIKLGKIKNLLRELILVSSPGLNAFISAVRGFLFLLIVLHTYACLWHLLGDSVDGGWVSESGAKDVTVMRRYAYSLHWMIIKTSYGSSGVRLTTTLEIVIDFFMSMTILMYLAMLSGLLTNLVIAWANSDASQKANIARVFVNAHNLPWELASRIHAALNTLQLGGVSEVLAHESKLKQSLPERLSQDIHYEVRWPIVNVFPFLAHMHEYNPRCIHRLCHSAMSEFMGVTRETIFEFGDACTCVYFLEKGECSYQRMKNKFKLEYMGSFCTTVNCKYPAQKSFHTNILDDRSMLSEPVLWTHWEHAGVLRALSDSILIALDAEQFMQVVTAHTHAKIHATKYAVHFCWHLNRVEDPSDDISFDLSPHTLDTEELFIGGTEDHFAFISHFKMESGTEATLLRNEMEKLIRADPLCPAGQFKTPIFIDSEDLVDLTRLTNHVKGSHVLIILLSPDFFTRPWCLLEIVTTKRNGRPFVPVLLQRPGLHVRFPDDRFFEQLHRDEVIDGGAQGRKLLMDLGIELDEVEQAIRAIKMMIALPFSPHKTEQVRRAEVNDILKRCTDLSQL